MSNPVDGVTITVGKQVKSLLPLATVLQSIGEQVQSRWDKVEAGQMFIIRIEVEQEEKEETNNDTSN